jgi:hypothetical protein
MRGFRSQGIRVLPPILSGRFDGSKRCYAAEGRQGFPPQGGIEEFHLP